MTEIRFCPSCGTPNPGAKCPGCGTRFVDGRPVGVPAKQDPMLGREVAGRFLIRELVGKGGMGRVYRAIHTELEREIALKLLHPHTALDEDTKRRFLQEARAASRLNHPGSAVVYDFGEWEGRLFLAMEFLVGAPLGHFSKERFPLEPEEVVDLLSQVCEVLQVAHNQGVLHRDIKPDNIMVLKGPGDKPLIKLVDFGLAFLQDRVDERLTRENMTMGTPAYISPEQAKARDLDARSDLYSLGVVLYELLCGKVPFNQGNPTDILVQHLYDEPPPPSKMAPELEIHRGLEELALRSLAKDPDQRPQSALDFRDNMLSAIEMVPSSSKDPSTKQLRPQKKSSRKDRALAMGLKIIEPSVAELSSEEASTTRVVVVERTAKFADSITAAMRAREIQVARIPSLDEAAAALRDHSPDALVVDLRGRPKERLDHLAQLIESGSLGETPIITVGPVDSIEPMSRSLELGVIDYIPGAAVSTKLFQALRRLKRAKRTGP